MSLGRIDDAADLTVADSGPGIPAEDRERVLERFVRLDTSRGAPGSGLGLSLVAAVAKLHDVALAPHDNPSPQGRGLKVTLRFAADADRKSVGEGKMVAVPVGLGGGR